MGTRREEYGNIQSRGTPRPAAAEASLGGRNGRWPERNALRARAPGDDVVPCRRSLESDGSSDAAVRTARHSSQTAPARHLRV